MKIMEWIQNQILKNYHFYNCSKLKMICDDERTILYITSLEMYLEKAKREEPTINHYCVFLTRIRNRNHSSRAIRDFRAHPSVQIITVSRQG